MWSRLCERQTRCRHARGGCVQAGCHALSSGRSESASCWPDCARESLTRPVCRSGGQQPQHLPGSTSAAPPRLQRQVVSVPVAARLLRLRPVRSNMSAASYCDAMTIIADFAAAQRQHRALRRESVPLVKAVGRVCCSDVLSPRQLPLFDVSAMDGFAVTSAITASASPTSPLRLLVLGCIAAGDAAPVHCPTPSLSSALYCYEIMTGAPFPSVSPHKPGGAVFDACVRIEDVTVMRDVDTARGDGGGIKAACPRLGQQTESRRGHRSSISPAARRRRALLPACAGAGCSGRHARGRVGASCCRRHQHRDASCSRRCLTPTLRTSSQR